MYYVMQGDQYVVYEPRLDKFFLYHNCGEMFTQRMYADARVDKFLASKEYQHKNGRVCIVETHKTRVDYLT